LVPVLLALTGAPEPITAAVIPVFVGPESELGLSVVGERVAKAAAWRPTLLLLGTEELFVRDVGDTGARLKNCGADEACLAGELARISVHLGILIIVNTEVSPPVLAIRALDVDNRKIVEGAVGALEPDEATLADAVTQRSRKIFDRLGHLEAARLVVTTIPETNDVIIDPAPIFRPSTNSYWLKPGRYRLSVRAGIEPAQQREIEVVGGRELVLEIDLRPQESLSESPWLWIGVGAAVLIAASVVTIAQVTRGEVYCVGRPDGC
jgi:hypothetical protein